MSTKTVRGIDLHYDEAEVPAKQPYVLWGHGLSSSRASEDAFGLLDWDQLRQRTSFIRYDARGHGESTSTPEPSTYHWRELAQDQLALADALGIDGYIAGGASMGCATALHAADLAPERIAALLLLIPPTAWATRAAQQHNYEVSAGLIDAGRLNVIVTGARAAAPPDPLAEEPAWRDRFEHTIRTTDPVRLARIFRGAAATDLPSPEAISRVRVPTMILAWTGDPAHPVATAQRLSELIPHAHMHIASTREELRGWTDLALGFVASL